MAAHNPFRVISGNEEDPQVKERRETLRRLLNDLLSRLDEVDIETFVFLGIMDDGSVISGRHVLGNYYQLLGAMEKQKSDVLTLLNQASDIAPKTEY